VEITIKKPTMHLSIRAINVWNYNANERTHIDMIEVTAKQGSQIISTSKKTNVHIE
jgi:hypothetical protein